MGDQAPARLRSHTSRSPVRVRSGSTWSMTSVSWATAPASPPVAIHVAVPSPAIASRIPRDDALQHADVAVVEPGLHGGDGRGPDQLVGLPDLDARQTGRALEEGIRRDLHPGTDDAPQILTLAGDRVEGVVAVPKSTTIVGRSAPP